MEVLKTKVPNWENEKKRGIFKKNGGFFPNFGKKLINLFIFRTKLVEVFSHIWKRKIKPFFKLKLEVLKLILEKVENIVRSFEMVKKGMDGI